MPQKLFPPPYHPFEVESPDVGFQTTTLTAFQDHITWTPTLLPGDYEAEVTYFWNHNAAGSDFEAQLLVAGAVIGDRLHKQEPKDSAGPSYPPGSGPGTSQSYPVEYTIPLGPRSGAVAFVLQFRTDSGGDESTIWNAKIRVRRLP